MQFLLPALSVHPVSAQDQLAGVLSQVGILQSDLNTAREVFITRPRQEHHTQRNMKTALGCYQPIEAVNCHQTIEPIVKPVSWTLPISFFHPIVSHAPYNL